MSTSTKELIILDFLTGNEPATLFPLQVFLQNHLAVITIFWWIIWISVIVFLVSYYILFPLLKNKFTQSKYYEHKPKKIN